jgi:hypothetical protein
VGVTRLKWSDDYADSLRLVAVNGKARVNRRAHPGGAVRGVAFLVRFFLFPYGQCD